MHNADIPRQCRQYNYRRTPDPYAQAFADTLKRNREQQEAVGRPLGALLGAALYKRQPKALVLVIKCERYITALVSYDDGSLKSINLAGTDGNAVDRAKLAAYQTALPNLNVVDGGC